MHTGFGEEGAEALVGVGGFTFLGQVSIGLWKDGVSEDSQVFQSVLLYWTWRFLPEYHAQDSRAAREKKHVSVI